MTTMDDIWLDVMQQQNCCMDHGCLKFKYQLQCIDRTNKWWNVFFGDALCTCMPLDAFFFLPSSSQIKFGPYFSYELWETTDSIIL